MGAPKPRSEAVKAHAADYQRTRRDAARLASSHQCEYEGCTTITTVHPVRGQGLQPHRFCQKHVGKVSIEAAARARSWHSRHITTPAKTHRTRRQKGWRRSSPRKPMANATELAAQMRSPAMRLAGRLGVIWRQAGLTPRLSRLTYRGRGTRREGRPRDERLPGDPRELLVITGAVRKAKDRGAGFVAIGRAVGQPYKWHVYADRYGNETKCEMASKLHRFSLELDQRLPGWTSY